MIRRLNLSTPFARLVVALAIVVAGVALAPTATRAEEGPRSCICLSGSGGCFPQQYWCCEWNGPTYECGCALISYGASCTNNPY